VDRLSLLCLSNHNRTVVATTVGHDGSR
jgi:hypothetical protein